MPPYQLRSGQRLCAFSLGEKVIAGSAALRGVAMHQDVSGAWGRCRQGRVGCGHTAGISWQRATSVEPRAARELGAGRLRVEVTL